jgi:hypothetical protein
VIVLYFWWDLHCLIICCVIKIEFFIEIPIPTCDRSIFGGVIAGQRLLVTLEHLGNLHHVREIDIRQNVHQLLQIVVPVVVAKLQVLER